MASVNNRVFCWDVDGVLIKYDPVNPSNDWRRALVEKGLWEAWEIFQDSAAWNDCLRSPEAQTIPRLKEYLVTRKLNPDYAEFMVRTWLTGNIDPDMQAIAMLKDMIRRGCNCVIVSNQDALRAAFLDQWLDSIGLEDVPRYFSCRMGVAKPDRGFYKKVQEIISCDPGDLFLFDDRKEYVEAALHEGWQGQLVRPGASPVPPQDINF